MLRTFGNWFSFRRLEYDDNPNIQKTIEDIRNIPEISLLQGIDIKGHYDYGNKFLVEGMTSRETENAIRKFFVEYAKKRYDFETKLRVNHQVFSGKGEEKHYFDLSFDRIEEGINTPIPINKATIDYLVRV